MVAALSNVRFRGNSGHRRPLIRRLLLTQSGHYPLHSAAPSGILIRIATMLSA